jgi:hypothetical protein
MNAEATMTGAEAQISIEAYVIKATQAPKAEPQEGAQIAPPSQDEHPPEHQQEE